MSAKRYTEKPDRPSPFGYPAGRARPSDHTPESTFRAILHALTTATEPDEVLHQIAEGALRIGKADGTYIERVVDNQEVQVVAEHGRPCPRIGTRVAYPGSLTEAVIKKGKPEIVSDLTGDPRPMARHITERCGPCSALAAPLLAATDVLGALVLLRCPGTEPFTAEDASRILTLADLGTVTFGRVRMLEETERARQQANLILESVTDAFFALDRNWTFTYVNRQAELLLQTTRHELLGHNIWQEFPESVGSKFYHEYHEALTSHEPRDFEEYFAPLQVWWEIHAVPVRDGLTVYFRDVTSRKRREEALRVLAEAGAVLSATLNYRETLSRVARLAIPTLADWSVVDIVEDGKVERIEVAVADPSKQDLAKQYKQYPPDPTDTDNPIAKVLRTGKPILVPEVGREFLESSARGPEHVELALQMGIRSLMTVPLIARGHTVGVLSLIAAESGRSYGEEDLALARDLADRAALAVDNARLFKLAQHNRAEAERRAAEEEALRRAAAAVSAVFTIKEMVQEIAQSALAATNADGALVERVDWPTQQVEVVAVAGRRALPLGARVPQRGSLAEHVLHHKRSEFIQRLSSEAGRISVDLVAACPDCAGLAVPLEDAGQAIGALILLRDEGHFSDDEAERARTFADLAALAFRKVYSLEESERQRQELAAVIESRSRLIRGFSHDVRNPLGAADGFLQLLESDVYETIDEAKEVIARARRALHDGMKLIGDLLELAKAEAGQIAVGSETVEIAEVVKEMAETYRAHAQRKGLELDVEIEPELPVIRSDASRVRQVLGNLVTNAIKYTQEGGVSIRATVRVDDRNAPASGRWIALEVRDTGPGIAEEEQKLLFEEFQRLETARAEQGSGIGLAIGRRVARTLGGEITVKSAPGAGATFTLWLPYDGTAEGAT